jgi:ribonuclease HII
MAGKYVIGIDEVGRGALAGPVVVAALAIPEKFRIIKKENFPKLKDSKKLSPRQREIWLGWIKSRSEIFYATAGVYPKVIDRINISRAAELAAGRAFKKLARKIGTVSAKRSEILLDGGLYLRGFDFQKLKQKTIIKGDEKIPAISLASIAAKVFRDGIMRKKRGDYPEYGFSSHKGYGTKNHFCEIRKFGITKIHRLTFLKQITA